MIQTSASQEPGNQGSKLNQDDVHRLVSETVRQLENIRRGETITPAVHPGMHQSLIPWNQNQLMSSFQQYPMFSPTGPYFSGFNCHPAMGPGFFPGQFSSIGPAGHNLSGETRSSMDLVPYGMRQQMSTTTPARSVAPMVHSPVTPTPRGDEAEPGDSGKKCTICVQLGNDSVQLLVRDGNTREQTPQSARIAVFLRYTVQSLLSPQARRRSESLSFDRRSTAVSTTDAFPIVSTVPIAENAASTRPSLPVTETPSILPTINSAAAATSLQAVSEPLLTIGHSTDSTAAENGATKKFSPPSANNPVPVAWFAEIRSYTKAFKNRKRVFCHKCQKNADVGTKSPWNFVEIHVQGHLNKLDIFSCAVCGFGSHQKVKVFSHVKSRHSTVAAKYQILDHRMELEGVLIGCLNECFGPTLREKQPSNASEFTTSAPQSQRILRDRRNRSRQNSPLSQELAEKIQTLMLRKPVRCKLCRMRKIGANPAKIRSHIFRHMPENERMITCTICAKQTRDSYKYMWDHIRREHRSVEINEAVQDCSNEIIRQEFFDSCFGESQDTVPPSETTKDSFFEAYLKKKIKDHAPVGCASEQIVRISCSVCCADLTVAKKTEDRDVGSVAEHIYAHLQRPLFRCSLCSMDCLEIGEHLEKTHSRSLEAKYFVDLRPQYESLLLSMADTCFKTWTAQQFIETITAFSLKQEPVDNSPPQNSLTVDENGIIDLTDC